MAAAEGRGGGVGGHAEWRGAVCRRGELELVAVPSQGLGTFSVSPSTQSPRLNEPTCFRLRSCPRINKAVGATRQRKGHSLVQDSTVHSQPQPPSSDISLQP